MTLKEILENTEQAIDSGKDNLEDYAFDLIQITSKSVYDHDIITPETNMPIFLDKWTVSYDYCNK